MEINLTPIVSQNQHVFKWNKDEIKTYFEAQLELKMKSLSTEQRLINSVKKKNENSKDQLSYLKKK